MKNESHMTYKKLLSFLNNLSEEELNMTATIQISDEFFAVSHASKTDDFDDILDANHPVIVVIS